MRAGFHLALHSDEERVSTPPSFFCAETSHLSCSPSSDPVCIDATAPEGGCPRVEARKPHGGDPAGLGFAAGSVPLLISLPVVKCKERFGFSTARLVPGTCRGAGAATGCACGRAALPARIGRRPFGTRSRTLRTPEGSTSGTFP